MEYLFFPTDRFWRQMHRKSVRPAHSAPLKWINLDTFASKHVSASPGSSKSMYDVLTLWKAPVRRKAFMSAHMS